MEPNISSVGNVDFSGAKGGGLSPVRRLLPMLLVAFVVAFAFVLERTVPAYAAGPRKDTTKTVSTSISSEATVATPASGKLLIVRAALLRSDTAGVVVFKSGTAGTTVANIYLEANKPLLITSDQFGVNGLRLLAVDAPLTATLTSATLTGVFSVSEE